MTDHLYPTTAPNAVDIPIGRPGTLRVMLAVALGATWPLMATIFQLDRLQTFIGYSVAGSLVIALAHSSPTTRQRWTLWCGVVGIPVFAFLIDVAHQMIYRLTPTTIDVTLLKLDARIVGDFAFQLSRWLQSHYIVCLIANRCYLALGLVNSMVFALAYNHHERHARAVEMLALWGLAGALGAVGYLLFPAIGPRWVLPTWPATPSLAEIARATPWIGKPRNAMPSLHATWVMLTLYCARWLTWRAWICLLPWAALTLLMTLGGGEHYAIDLLVAVPFSAAVIVTVHLAMGGLKRARAAVDCAVTETPPSTAA